MKIINADVKFITPIDGAAILKRLEQCGRVCYKSEARITDINAPAFVAGIIKRGHEAVLEHCSFTVIKPCFLYPNTDGFNLWEEGCLFAEQTYFNLLECGCSPQEARSVLPNSLKTEVVMTANIREWRHFLKLRCSPAAHPQMREVALILLDKVHSLIPVCFDDIWSEYHEQG